MEHTTIEWADHSFNPWRGCTKVSPGCAHCYAEAQAKRNPSVLGEWGPGKPRVRASAKAWLDVERWNRELICDTCGKPLVLLRGRQNHSPARVGEPCTRGTCRGIYRKPRVFCASLADWLDDADVRMPDGRIDKGGIETLADLLDGIRRWENLDMLMLTKRIENFDRRLLDAQLYLIDQCKHPAHFSRRSSMAATAAWLAFWRCGAQVPPNVWLGVSAENQEYWDKRVPILLSTPAAVRFVSCEPLLGPISNMFCAADCRKETVGKPPFDGHWHRGIEDSIHWVIFGGESGPKARPCNVEWIRDGVRQCREAGVKAFVKQLGANIRADPHGRDGFKVWSNDGTCRPFLKDRKGGLMAEWPEEFRVREWPG